MTASCVPGMGEPTGPQTVPGSSDFGLWGGANSETCSRVRESESDSP